MFMVNQLIGFGCGGSAVAATVTYKTFLSSTLNAATYTFNTVDIGPASADRRIVVGVHSTNGSGTGGTAESAISVTVNGVSAVLVANTTDLNANWVSAELWIAEVPTDTSVTIVITWDHNAARMGAGVWAITGLTSTTPTATSSDTSDPFNLDLNTSAGGVVIGISINETVSTVTWTGLTENYDATVESTINFSGASSLIAVAGSPTTITADLASAGTDICGLAAHWI